MYLWCTSEPRFLRFDSFERPIFPITYLESIRCWNPTPPPGTIKSTTYKKSFKSDDVCLEAGDTYGDALYQMILGEKSVSKRAVARPRCLGEGSRQRRVVDSV